MVLLILYLTCCVLESATKDIFTSSAKVVPVEYNSIQHACSINTSTVASTSNVAIN